MINKVTLVGRLGQEPEIKHTSSGTVICRFSLATDENYLRNGQPVEKVEWHKIVVFNKVAKSCAQYLSKGSLIYLEGSLTTSKWTDESGNNHYTTEVRGNKVQFLPSNKKGGDNA